MAGGDCVGGSWMSCDVQSGWLVAMALTRTAPSPGLGRPGDSEWQVQGRGGIEGGEALPPGPTRALCMVKPAGTNEEAELLSSAKKNGAHLPKHKKLNQCWFNAGPAS